MPPLSPSLRQVIQSQVAEALPPAQAPPTVTAPLTYAAAVARPRAPASPTIYEATRHVYSSTPPSRSLTVPSPAVYETEIWDSVLEVRIQLQKLLVLANHFPKHDQYSLFRAAALEQDKKNGNLLGQGAKSSVELVMHQLLTLQEHLRDSYPEIQSIFSNATDKERKVEDEIDSENEEIPSDTEAEESSDESESEPSECSPGKRKACKQGRPDKPTKCRKMDACVALAAEFWTKFEPYRNATIEKWYERTRLLSGKVGRSFASLEQSPVKQIEHLSVEMVNISWAAVTATCARDCFREADFVDVGPDAEPEASKLRR
ncbi:hypothetical protein HPB51_017572 [Rhipicephalus microplus]|uniref:AATF leucine zipper-containing domain-containing protein n=1 Tax=Rhipicephalus microplus TaxID=6941 RepID=A0A9J6F7W5_RHIMP|nr:hypothetical protein HPB51_017572 [Rhipicephalus microplus]